jgi:hypothetical protein
MRAVLAAIAALALCSCDDTNDLYVDAPPPTAPAAPADLELGDGWTVTSGQTDGGEAAVFICQALRADTTGGVIVTLYIPGESQQGNPAINLMFAVSAEHLPSPVGRYYGLVFPGTRDMIPIDPRETRQLEDGLTAFYGATEFEPQLTEILTHQRSVSLVQTDKMVRTEQLVATMDLPYPEAVRQALIQCEATRGAEQPTRAAYFAHRR